MSRIEVRTFAGAEIAPYLDTVAALRIAVLREWPYLYAGDRALEERYLAAYARSTESLVALAFHGERVVGVSTGLPLADEAAVFQQPFLDREIAIEDVFHFGESVLLADYRGMGLGHRFFDERERHARQLGRFTMTAFCAVERAPDDPRRPESSRPDDVFWGKRGYRRQDDMLCQVEWPEIGASAQVRHCLHVWLRSLESA